MLLLSPSSGGCHIHRTFRHNPQRPSMVCRPELIRFRPGDSMLQLLCLVCQILVADYFSALWPPTHCSSLFRQIHSKEPSVSRAIADKALFQDYLVKSAKIKKKYYNCNNALFFFKACILCKEFTYSRYMRRLIVAGQKWVVVAERGSLLLDTKAMILIWICF